MHLQGIEPEFEVITNIWYVGTFVRFVFHQNSVFLVNKGYGLCLV